MKFLQLNKLEGNKRKILTNVAWATMGKVVNMAGALFVGILVARYLGPEQYGLMNYVISFVMLFTVVSSFGLDNIEIRELAKKPEERHAILGTCFGLRWAFSLLAFLLIVVTLIVRQTDAFTTTMILVYSSTLFLQNFNVIRNYFFSIVKNEYVVKTEVFRTLIGAAIKIFLLMMKAPLALFIIATAFDALLIASGYSIAYRRIVGKISQWHFDRQRVAFLVKESFPLVLSGAAVIIYQRIDQVMIGDMIDSESVGYFATAGKFLDIILFVPMVLTQTIAPLLVSQREVMPKEEFMKKKIQFVGMVVWCSILLSLLFSLCSRLFILMTFGMEYMAAVPVLKIMSWKTVGMALSFSAGQIIIMEGIQKYAVIRNLMGCVACVGLNLIALPRYGIIGSAWVTIITTSITGFFGNLLIPAYHGIFKLQVTALLNGWREVANIRSLLR